VWLIGARGSVATTVIVGAAAIRAGPTPPVGCVTETRDFAGAGRNRLARVVVINVASTEPLFLARPEHANLGSLEQAMAQPGEVVLPPSSLYAYAALRAGCAYVDFTPSTGMRIAALDELARQRGVPYAGNDAKTGETLVKTALAPMFASRALTVRSWSGTNLLGGGDGATLADPAAGQSKKLSKETVRWPRYSATRWTAPRTSTTCRGWASGRPRGTMWCSKASSVSR
jgi:Myo-inositol-1-phosphate synthase